MKSTIEKSKKIFLLLLIIALGSCSNDPEELNETLKEIDPAIEKAPSQFQNSKFYKPPASNIKKVKFTGTTTAQLNDLIKKNSKLDGPGVIIRHDTGIDTSTY